MILRILALALLVTGLNSAYAQEELAPEIEFLETCELTSRTLTKGLQIYCDGDLKVAEGTEVVTNGHFFQVSANGAVDLSGTLLIDAKGTPGAVLIYAGLHISGAVKIQNADLDGYGGYVEITAGALAPDYTQEINNGLDNNTRVTVAGEELYLLPELNKIARN